MNFVRCHFARFVRDDGAATAVEYALLLGLLSLALIGGITAMGTAVNGKMNEAATALA